MIFWLIFFTSVCKLPVPFIWCQVLFCIFLPDFCTFIEYSPIFSYFLYILRVYSVKLCIISTVTFIYTFSFLLFASVALYLLLQQCFSALPPLCLSFLLSPYLFYYSHRWKTIRSFNMIHRSIYCSLLFSCLLTLLGWRKKTRFLNFFELSSYY